MRLIKIEWRRRSFSGLISGGIVFIRRRRCYEGKLVVSVSADDERICSAHELSTGLCQTPKSTFLLVAAIAAGLRRISVPTASLVRPESRRPAITVFVERPRDALRTSFSYKTSLATWS